MAGRDILKKVIHSEIFRNTSILVSGTIIAQLIPVLLQVVLRRLYQPEVFGAYSVFFSLMGVSVFFFTFRYEMAIINPEKDEEAQNLLSVIFIISIVSAVIWELLYVIFHNEIVSLLKFPEKYSWWLYFLPLVLLFYAWYLGIQYWLVRKKNFKGISVNKISRRSVEGILQVAFGLIGKSYGMFLGLLGGIMTNFFVGVKQSVKSGFSITNISVDKMKRAAKNYKEYPLFNTIPAFLNTAGMMLPVFIINKYYGTSITGYFDLTRQVLAVPVGLLSVALSQVYMQRFAEKFNKSVSIKKDIISLWVFLAIISLVSFVIIFWGGEWLFGFVFGKQWSLSGQYAEILIYKYVLVFMVSPVSSVLISIKKVKVISLWQSLYFFMILLLLAFTGYGFLSFLKVYVIIELVAYSLYLFLIVHNVAKYEKSLG
jgi:O-antigen/teichoic acid export membrane protein